VNAFTTRATIGPKSAGGKLISVLTFPVNVTGGLIVAA
jgi:hypothetical protein